MSRCDLPDARADSDSHRGLRRSYIVLSFSTYACRAPHQPAVAASMPQSNHHRTPMLETITYMRVHKRHDAPARCPRSSSGRVSLLSPTARSTALVSVDLPWHGLC